MEHSVKTGDGPRDVIVSASGSATVEGFRQLYADVDLALERAPGALILVDLSALDVSPLTQAELQLVSELAGERDWDRPAAAVALVAPDDSTFEAATSHRAYLGGTRSRREVFRSRSDALAWLRARGTDTEA